MVSFIIKELRERKAVLCIGILLTLLPRLIVFICSLSGEWNDITLRDLSFGVSYIEFLVLSVFFTMFIASPSIAGELERKNMQFIFSLPVSKRRVWLAKFISCLISQMIIVSFFMLINQSLLHPEDIIKNYHGSLGILIFLIPFLMLSITFFTSAISSNEMSSNGLALLLFVISILFVGGLSYFLSWIMSGFAMKFIVLLLVLFYSGISYSVFTGPFMLDAGKKMLFSAKTTFISLITLAAILCIVYFCDMRYLYREPESIDFMELKGDNLFIHADYAKDRRLRQIGLSDMGFRMLIIDLKSGKSFNAGGNQVIWADITPLNTVDFNKIKRIPQVFGYPVSKTSELSYYRMNYSDGSNRRLIYRTTIPSFIYNYIKTSTFYIKNNTVIFSAEMEPGDNIKCSLNIVVIGPDEKIKRKIKLPDIFAKYYPKVYEVNEKLYIFYEHFICSTKPSFFDSSPTALDCIDPLNANLKSVYKSKTSSYFFRNEFSSDGQYLALWQLKKEKINNDHSIDVVVRNLRDGTEKIITNSSGEDIFMHKWMDGEKKLAIIKMAHNGEYHISLKVLLYDAENRRMIYEIPVSDIKDEIIIRNSIKWIPDGNAIVFSSYDREKKRSKITIFNLGAMKKQTNDEKSFVNTVALSCDLKKLAFIAWESFDANGLKPTGKNMIVIQNLETSERKEFPSGKSNWTNKLIWTKNNELITANEKPEVYIIKDSGSRIQKLFP